MIDLKTFSTNEEGLTSEEIKKYLLARFNDLTFAQKRTVENRLRRKYHFRGIFSDELFQAYNDITGVNTCMMKIINGEQVIINYFCDVENATNKLLFNKDFLWD
jgi:hypothetical protein